MEMIVGSKIKEFRKTNHVTQHNLAEKLCVSKQTVSKWETNACYPDVFLLPKIAKVLCCSIDDFFTE